jgi:hypothetical protein
LLDNQDDLTASIERWAHALPPSDRTAGISPQAGRET